MGLVASGIVTAAWLHRLWYSLQIHTIFPPASLRVRQISCSVREQRVSNSLALHPQVLCLRHDVRAALSTKWLISSLVFLLPQLHPRAQPTVINLLYPALGEAFALLHTVGTRQRIKTSSNTLGTWFGAPQTQSFTSNVQSRLPRRDPSKQGEGTRNPLWQDGLHWFP